MPRKKAIPSYRLHKQSGQAIVTLTDSLGNRRDVLLGTFDSPESRLKYAQVIAEWEAKARQLVSPQAAKDITINELVLLFWPHAQQHYRRPDGTLTNELDEYKRACRPLCHLYGKLPAKDFGPLALKTVRELMITGYEHPEYGPQDALACGVINQRSGRIRRLFRWAVENELVPNYQGAQVVVVRFRLMEKALLYLKQSAKSEWQ